MVPGHQCAEQSERVRRTMMSGGPSCGMRIEIGRLPWRSGATGRSHIGQSRQIGASPSPTDAGAGAGLKTRTQQPVP
jgi:hypothetical protein